jgi:hypothetical protein
LLVLNKALLVRLRDHPFKLETKKEQVNLLELKKVCSLFQADCFYPLG